ncbi:MAG TPA: 50S ribosomal protein L9 [Gammaproteobacteria bacterium]|nr:50S ribosomal protein L9 [Gammaproteobacteria bacterium]HBA32972.1 50S ribosomal protein L9 [Gammaproteobacteria bacterium]
MQVILMDKIENLGNLGDVVEVKPGYARNMLLPQGKAKVATAENVKEIEARRAELEKKSADELTAAKGRAAQIEALAIVITANAGTEGKLFGSIGPHDIAQAASDQGVTLEKREVRMPEGPLRSVGEYEVAVHLHTDVDTFVKVTIEGVEETD